MLKIYFVCLTYILIATDVARCKPNSLINIDVDGWVNLKHAMPATWEETRCHHENLVVRCNPCSEYSFDKDAGKWLKLHTIPATWEEAFLKCHNEGAVLASPLNKTLADALHSQMTHCSVSGHMFLGTHDLFSKGNYISVEGVPLADMKLIWGTHGADTGDCLTMSADGYAHYSSCNNELPFICYKNFFNQTMNECGTFDNDYHLNQQTGSCYKIHYEKRSWTPAYSICASEGGYLVILNDEEEARVVLDMFPPLTEGSNSWERFHVGLKAWGRERIWTTIHGEKIEDVFNKWHPGQPDNLRGDQDRGAFVRTGHLDDVNEEVEVLMFVCEKPPISNQTQTDLM